MSRPVAGLVTLSLLARAAPAFACPVCGTANSEATRKAFVGSTIFLSLLPLALIGAFVAWGLWRVKRQAREREAAPPAARGGEAPLSTRSV